MSKRGKAARDGGFLLLQDRRFYKWVHKLKKWGTGGGQSAEKQKKRYGRIIAIFGRLC